MPIQNQPLTSLSLTQIKGITDNISRNAFKLMNPGGAEGKLYVDTAPTVADLDEGSAVFYFDGATYKLYFRINGVIKSATLT
jgi:hypothetical protein